MTKFKKITDELSGLGIVKKFKVRIAMNEYVHTSSFHH